jgi:hypothetical protein
VLAELMEEEVAEVVGPKGKHNPERMAVRHGHEAGEVTLGGRRVQVERVGCLYSDFGILVLSRGSGRFYERCSYPGRKGWCGGVSRFLPG